MEAFLDEVLFIVAVVAGFCFLYPFFCFIYKNRCAVDWDENIGKNGWDHMNRLSVENQQHNNIIFIPKGNQYKSSMAY